MNCIGATSYRQKPAENPLSARFRGEREGPAPEAWEGEVGDAADPDIGPLPPCPSPPACGGRGRGPAWLRREGEVGSSAVRDWGGSPHLTPTLSAPQGGEGDIPAACLVVRSVHAPAAREIGSRHRLPRRSRRSSHAFQAQG